MAWGVGGIRQPICIRTDMWSWNRVVEGRHALNQALSLSVQDDFRWSEHQNVIFH